MNSDKDFKTNPINSEDNSAHTPLEQPLSASATLRKLNIPNNKMGDNSGKDHIEQLGQKAGFFWKTLKGKTEQYPHEDIKLFSKQITETTKEKFNKFSQDREKSKPKLADDDENLETKAESLSVKDNSFFQRTKNGLAKTKVWVKRNKFITTIALVCIFLAYIDRHELIVYGALHMVMAVFALIHTLSGFFAIIIDNIFNIGFFNNIDNFLFDITYEFYTPFFKITNSVSIWMKWVNFLRDMYYWFG